MSELRSPKRRDDAHGRLSVFLRMRELQNAVETAKRRLLCVLLIWYDKVSTNTTIPKLLCLISSDTKDVGLCSTGLFHGLKTMRVYVD
jgi:hypothetical protein